MFLRTHNACPSYVWENYAPGDGYYPTWGMSFSMSKYRGQLHLVCYLQGNKLARLSCGNQRALIAPVGPVTLMVISHPVFSLKP